MYNLFNAVPVSNSDNGNSCKKLLDILNVSSVGGVLILGRIDVIKLLSRFSVDKVRSFEKCSGNDIKSFSPINKCCSVSCKWFQCVSITSMLLL